MRIIIEFLIRLLSSCAGRASNENKINSSKQNQKKKVINMQTYKEHQISTVESTSHGQAIYYAYIDGVQQIDYTRGRGDYKSAELAMEFAKNLA
jgi:PBP1b-binding outer membrane lipoprotein LpoB